MTKLLILLGFFCTLAKAKNFNIINKNTAVFAISVIKNGKVISREITGEYKNKKADFNHIFILNSMSKQFTAAAILLLEEQKKISLNDKISKFFPEIANLVDNITILHLITHSGGIPDYLNDPNLDMDKMVENNEVINFNYVMNYIKTHEFQEVDKYNYSNSGYVLLAKIIEKVSDMPFGEFIEKNIFQKLKMQNTYILHYNGKDACMPGHTAWPIFLPKERDSVLQIDGDGGVCSNIVDYEKWIIALEKHQVFAQRKTSLKFMEKIRLPNGKLVVMPLPGKNLSTYGYGWRHGFYKDLYPIMWHPGSMSGSNSMAIYFIEKDTWIIFFSNSSIADVTNFGIETGLKIINQI